MNKQKNIILKKTAKHFSRDSSFRMLCIISALEDFFKKIYFALLKFLLESHSSVLQTLHIHKIVNLFIFTGHSTNYKNNLQDPIFLKKYNNLDTY